jgi:hypothetical protein
MADTDDDDDDELDDDGRGGHRNGADNEEEDGEEDEEIPRTGPARRRRGATAAAGGQGGTAKKRARSARPAEVAGIATFVAGTIRITADGKVALFIVGDKSRVTLAAEGRSLLAVYEYLAAKPPPTGTFQRAIDSLPGAESKKLNGIRRVLGITVQEDLSKIDTMLRSPELEPILKEVHIEALKSDTSARELSTHVRSMLITMEGNSQYAPKTGRTQAAAAAAPAPAAAPAAARAGPTAAPAPAEPAQGAAPAPAPAPGAGGAEPAEGAAGGGVAGGAQEEPDVLKGLISSPAFLACRLTHSERTWEAAEALARVPGGPFSSPSGTGETARAARDVISKMRESMRTVHSYQAADEPSTSAVDPDGLRLMQLAKKYPKAVKDIENLEKKRHVAAAERATRTEPDAADTAGADAAGTAGADAADADDDEEY